LEVKEHELEDLFLRREVGRRTLGREGQRAVHRVGDMKIGIDDAATTYVREVGDWRVDDHGLDVRRVT